MNECTHTKKVGGEWVDNPYYDLIDEGYESDELINMSGCFFSKLTHLLAILGDEI